MTSARDDVMFLRHAGFPVAAIAEMVRCDRRRVYAWLSGNDLEAPQVARLARIAAALGPEEAARGSWRFWMRPLGDGPSLRQLLCRDDIDEPAIRAALARLLPHVERQRQHEAKRANMFPSRDDAPLLEDMPVADLGCDD